MVGMLAVLTVLAALTAFYFGFEAFRARRMAEEYADENRDLHNRLSNLVSEVRRVRTASPGSITQSTDDELMPIRREPAGPLKSARAARATESPDTVVILSSDVKEVRHVSDILTANGYRVATSPLNEAAAYAHALTTAALLFDLRDPAFASGAREMVAAMAKDPLAKEVPSFALVSTNIERERQIDEGAFSATFVTPADPALLISSLGAAIIRRRTRSQRAQVARKLSSLSSAH